MEVFLVQHGAAESKTVDPARPLSASGRQDVARVAAVAARMGLQVHQIRHSGKLRAEQTAAALGDALDPPGGVVAVSGLDPLDDVEPVAAALARETQPAMLVGHLPFMGRLAGLLLVGDTDRAVVRFEPGGIACLARDAEQWQVKWILTPLLAAA